MEKTVLPRLAKAMNGREFSLPKIFFVSSHYVLCIRNYDVSDEDIKLVSRENLLRLLK